MMGTKERNFSSLEDLSLEGLVPEDNFYRRLEQTVDLSFVRELVRDCYASGGRPSVDPVVFFKNVSRECLLRKGLLSKIGDLPPASPDAPSRPARRGSASV